MAATRYGLLRIVPVILLLAAACEEDGGGTSEPKPPQPAMLHALRPMC